eukprot:5303523-Amphidinium_carterae.1
MRAKFDAEHGTCLMSPDRDTRNATARDLDTIATCSSRPLQLRYFETFPIFESDWLGFLKDPQIAPKSL